MCSACRPRFKNWRQRWGDSQRFAVCVIDRYALQVFSLTEAVHQPLQIFLPPVVQQGFNAFLQTFTENFRAAGKVVAENTPFGAHLVTGKQQRNDSYADY